MYSGTGNAAPYNAPRDWTGGFESDRLYAASILAVHGSTGTLAWYYQTTPGDIWDFDAAANLVLASLRISGVDRQVSMQANKNGFFYVIDRRSGRPISAASFAYMNWAIGMDSGFRLIVDRAAADYNVAPKIVYPSVLGAHSWQPMSYNPQTGLVYIPTLETGAILADVTKNRGSRISWLDQQLGVTEIVPDKTLSYDYWESWSVTCLASRRRRPSDHFYVGSWSLGPVDASSRVGAADIAGLCGFRRWHHDNSWRIGVRGSGRWRHGGLRCRNGSDIEDHPDGQ